VADDSGAVLLRLLRSSLISLLSDALETVTQSVGFSSLNPVGAEWAGSGLEDRLLEPPAAVMSANPVTGRVIDALRKLSSINRPDAIAGLFGWDPDPVGHSQSRGIACAVRLGPVGAPNFAVAMAVTFDAASSVRIDIVAKGNTGDRSTVLPLDARSALSVGARVVDTFEIGLPVTGPATVVRGSSGDAVRVGLTRAAAAQPAKGPGIDLGAIELFAEIKLSGRVPELTGGMRIGGGSVRITPGDLSAIVPALGPIPLDVALALSSSRGIDLAGSPTLAVRLPSGASTPAISTGPLDLALTPRPVPDSPSVLVHVSCPISLDLPAVPIHLDLEGMGFDIPFALGGPKLAFDLEGLVPQLPAGAGAALALPIVKGDGRMLRTGTTFAGMLAVVMPPVSVNALGLLDSSTGSFLVIIGATFPPPGIQLGFGFAITGVGGIVGVGRRVDRDALTRSVQDGTAASFLFPADPGARSQELLPALDHAFPPAPNSVVVGPMFRISWGGRILTASVAVVLELPDPVRISILGKLLLAVPDPAIPLVRIQATFLGQVDPGVPSMMFVASLTDSNIAGVTITGDVYLLVRGGDDADVVLSAGGFHPQFVRPAGVPALNRIAITLASGPFLQLRCQAYLAVTTNTVQFGARVDLVAEIAGCGLRGHLGFDVLIQLEPLRFIAEISVAVAVEVLGETLVGIALTLALEGPTPWRARGRGSIDLFLFSASFDFDETWGSPPPIPLATPDMADILGKAFGRSEAWIPRAPDPAASPVQLNAAGQRALDTGFALHPHGSLSARQRLVPLGVTIDRYNRQPIAPQRWDVSSPLLGAGNPVLSGGEEREQFAPAAFLAMTDDAQLSRPAFESFRAGLGLIGGSVVIDVTRSTDFDYETKVVSKTVSDFKPAAVTLGRLLSMAESVATAGIDDPRWWPEPPAVVTVATTPSFVAVDAWSFTAAEDVVAPSTNATAQFEAIAAVQASDPARRISVVEAWEVAAT
jgi:hypothetical protein